VKSIGDFMTGQMYFFIGQSHPIKRCGFCRVRAISRSVEGNATMSAVMGDTHRMCLLWSTYSVVKMGSQRSKLPIQSIIGWFNNLSESSTLSASSHETQVYAGRWEHVNSCLADAGSQRHQVQTLLLACIRHDTGYLECLDKPL